MKIKSDFITNSSSTSYVVFIPNEFDIDKFIELSLTLDQGLHTLNNVFDGNQSMYEQAMTNAFDDLLTHGTFDEYESQVYHAMYELLNTLDLVLSNAELGYASSDSGIIFNLNAEGIKEQVKPIKEGGWGLKHGGWGIETKD